MINPELIKDNFPYLTSSELRKFEIGIANITYIEQIKFIENQFVSVVFAIKESRLKRDNGKIFQQRVFAYDESGEMLINDNTYCSTMGGWRTLFPDTKKRQTGYYAYNNFVEQEVLRKIIIKNLPSFVYYAEKDYRIKDLYKLDLAVKYCAFDANTQSMPFIKYISKYRKYKSMEYLSKANIIWLMSDERFLKRLENDKDFARYVARNKEELSNSHFTYVDLLQSYKNNLSAKYALHVSELRKQSGYKDVKHLFDLKEVITKYKISEFTLYIDYLKMSIEYDIEYDVNVKSRDLERKHELASAISEIKRKYKSEQEKKEKETQFLKSLKAWWNIVKWEKGEYFVKLPESIEELEIEGAKLHHCVGNYTSRVISGESIIAFMRKKEEPEEPFYTVEINPETKQIIQVRTKYNQAITEEIRSVLSKWKEFQLAV